MDRIIGGIEVTPTLVAQMFLALDSGEQADFFASLDEMAGVKLCIQMAYTVSEIHDRAERGDHRAQNGFQTILNHAEHFVLDGIEARYSLAKYDIRRMAELAK